NALREITVSHPDRDPPMVGERPQPVGHRIEIVDFGIAEYFNRGAVMSAQQRLEEVADGMAPEIRRNIANPQPSVGIPIIAVFAPHWLVRQGMNFIPPSRFGID